MDGKRLLLSLTENSKWMKILGGLMIALGVFYCITIVGLIVGWIPLWLGYLAYTAGSLLDGAEEKAGDETRVLAVEKIALFFKICGILAVVYLVIIIVTFIIVFLVQGFGATT